MQLSQIKRNHPLWNYLIPIQSTHQCNIYFIILFIGLIVLSILTLIFDQNAFKWVFIGGTLGSLISLYGVLPKFFEVNLKDVDIVLVKTKILKKLDSCGYSLQEKNHGIITCKTDLNKWFTWNENKFLIKIERERILIIGPSFMLKKIHQYLLISESDFSFLENKDNK